MTDLFKLRILCAVDPILKILFFYSRETRQKQQGKSLSRPSGKHNQVYMSVLHVAYMRTVH